jgi:ABC-type Fe3+/spermidine/putrescine transport system ATPase subunit
MESGRETQVIIGPSGCGKTTVLRLLSGLLKPDQGEIRLGERVLFDSEKRIHLLPEARRIGFLFQNYALFPHLSVKENVGFGLKRMKLTKRERERRVEEMLERLNIAHLALNLPEELSGGEQQRAALARALVIEPELLLLDEPLSALDVTTRARVRRELKRTLQALNIPSIVVTHDYEDAVSLGERILVMDRGRVVQAGTAQELLLEPKSGFIADFGGTNYFDDVQVIESGGRTAVQLNQTVRLHTAKPLNLFTRYTLMIHPWDIRLFVSPPGLPFDQSFDHRFNRDNIVEGEILNILFYGNRSRIEVEGSLSLNVEMAQEELRRLGLKKGQRVWLVIDPRAVFVVEM